MNPVHDSARIEEHLAQILSSGIFRGAGQQSRFLKYVVDKSLAGDESALREAQIGVAVFERSPGYDSIADPIVRDEAARLRDKLREYYEAHPAVPVRIHLPKDGYIAAFPASSALPLDKPARRWWIYGAATAAVALAMLWFTTQRAPAPAITGPTAIAVLPFADLSEAQDQANLCDGLSEQITDELTRVAGLRVAGRTSAVRVQRAGADLREIGRQLNVQLLLQGSVRTTGSRVRVTAQLVDAATGYHSWSASFDGASNDVFGLEDQIARAVAQRLALELARPKEPEAARNSPKRKRAHDLFLEAREIHRKMNAATLRDAVNLHERSADADPTYALAHSGLSHVLTSGMTLGVLDSGSQGPRALTEARKAIELDPKLVDGHAAMIRVLRDVTHDWAAAETACRQALAATPNHSSLLTNCGSLDSILGRHASAIDKHRRSIAIDPLWTGAREGLTVALHRAGKSDEALAEAEAVRKASPDFIAIYPRLALILADRNNAAEAVAALDDARSRLGRDTAELASLRVYALGFNGRMDEARAAAADLRRIAGRNDHLELALGALSLGEISRAAGEVEQAAEAKAPNLADFLAEPFAKRLAQHPRFQEVRQQMRLD